MLPVIPKILRIEDLYQGFGGRMVLDNVDFHVQPGEFVTLVGPSGCGKSTLLRIIIGQDKPLRGKVFLNGDPIGPPSKKRGVVYQNYSLFPHLTVLENALVGFRHGLSLRQWMKRKAGLRDEAVAALTRADIGAHLDSYPHQLSGGQQQRAAIVQALLQRPMILCMDEPFSALDAGSRENMQIFLLQLWEEYKITIIFVTHDLEEALYLGTRIMKLSQHTTDDRGEGAGVNRGAKIVIDHFLRPPGTAVSPKIKETAEFGELLQKIRYTASKPEHRVHVRDFDLSHPDSWRTLTADECRV